MKNLFLILTAAFLFTGCASTSYVLERAPYLKYEYNRVFAVKDAAFFPSSHIELTLQGLLARQKEETTFTIQIPLPVLSMTVEDMKTQGFFLSSVEDREIMYFPQSFLKSQANILEKKAHKLPVVVHTNWCDLNEGSLQKLQSVDESLYTIHVLYPGPTIFGTEEFNEKFGLHGRRPQKCPLVVVQPPDCQQSWAREPFMLQGGYAGGKSQKQLYLLLPFALIADVLCSPYYIYETFTTDWAPP